MRVQMTNTIFYTFSTIAQTLAGAIALLGAFVLYRLQSLRTAIEQESFETAELYARANAFLVGDQDPRQWHRTGAYCRIAKLPQGIDMPCSFADPAAVHRLQSRLRGHCAHQKKLLKQFKFALRLTGWLILFAVGALVAAELIAPWGWPGCWLVLLCGFGWFGACIRSYVRLVRLALDDTSAPTKGETS
jgi:hypothetical protein